MNRIHTLSLPAESRTRVRELELDSAVFTPSTENTPCALFAPLHYEPHYAYPLLVWLHGPDDDESQLKRIMPLVSMRNYAAVAPRGTTISGPGRRRFSWGHSSADIALAEQHVFDSIALAERRFHVHPRRVFIGGYDCGGTMALRLALAHPDRFAGVLSLGGPLPGESCLRRLDEARHLNLFIAGGATSDHYPTQQVCDDLRLLHCAGMRITLRHYPCGQIVTSDMLADMNRWMMELVTSPGA
jgi:phospholipase/carboxylesterase